MFATWAAGDRRLLIVTRRSQIKGTMGSIVLFKLRLGESATLPVFSTQHLSIDVVNCHILAKLSV